MARKLRLEFPGSCYHVINRGNYRTDIFKTVGAAVGGRFLHATTAAKYHYPSNQGRPRLDRTARTTSLLT